MQVVWFGSKLHTVLQASRDWSVYFQTVNGIQQNQEGVRQLKTAEGRVSKVHIDASFSKTGSLEDPRDMWELVRDCGPLSNMI